MPECGLIPILLPAAAYQNRHRAFIAGIGHGQRSAQPNALFVVVKHHFFAVIGKGRPGGLRAFETRNAIGKATECQRKVHAVLRENASDRVFFVSPGVFHAERHCRHLKRKAVGIKSGFQAVMLQALHGNVHIHHRGIIAVACYLENQGKGPLAHRQCPAPSAVEGIGLGAQNCRK